LNIQKKLGSYRGFFKGYQGVFLTSQPKINYSRKIVLNKKVVFYKFEAMRSIYPKKSPYRKVDGIVID